MDDLYPIVSPKRGRPRSHRRGARNTERKAMKEEIVHLRKLLHGCRVSQVTPSKADAIRAFRRKLSEMVRDYREQFGPVIRLPYKRKKKEV